MTSRRSFLRSASLIATGVVAADQLEILERLRARRVFTTGGYWQRYKGSADFLSGNPDITLYNSGVFWVQRPASIAWVDANGPAFWTLTADPSAMIGCADALYNFRG